MFKKLDQYIFRQFIALLTVTFFICLFIIVMQFIWLRIDDMIGKGIPIEIMAKFFLYSSLSSATIALPLAILLASLMTFGNLGERLELIAMKTAGISLFRIMRPIMIFIFFIVIGAFFYSNYVIPIAQQRMWTLIFSFQDKALEIEIPVGEFYSGIRGINIYARGKDNDKRIMLDVMIYDFTKGFDNASVTAADTVQISTTEDKKYIKIVMKNGESFENVQNQRVGSNTIPYRRESFKSKELLFEFDTGFKEMDEKVMENQHISKNILKLMIDIDSINHRRDSLKSEYAKKLVTANNREQQQEMLNDFQLSPLPPAELAHDSTTNTISDIDSLFVASTQEQMVNIMQLASQEIESTISDVRYNTIIINESDDFFKTHNIEWHLKFTLSFACLIFFFIGAPLGAIIGKGGLGLPTVVSIILFIAYYIVNTMGQKMAREGTWEVWQGMWFSSAILLPIGIFLTYRAVKDTRFLEADNYRKLLKGAKQFLGKIRLSKEYVDNER